MPHGPSGLVVNMPIDPMSQALVRRQSVGSSLLLTMAVRLRFIK